MKRATNASIESTLSEAEGLSAGASVGFSTKLIVLFLLLAMIPLAVVSYLAFDNSRRTIEQDTVNHLLSITVLKEAELERWIEDSRRSLRELAQRPLIREYAAVLASHEPDEPEYQEARASIREDHLAPTREDEEDFLELFLLRASDGLILVSTTEKREGQYREDRPYFVEGRSRTYVQNAYYSPALEEAAMTIGTPVEDGEGNLVAVLAARVDMAKISDIMLQGSGLSGSEETYLVNKFNFFVTESRFEPGYTLKKAIHTEGVAACLRHNNGVSFYDDYRNVPVIGVYRWIPEWELCILTEEDQADALVPIIALRNTVLGIGVAVALIVAVLAVFFARTITGPVRQLVKGTEEIGRGNLEYRIEVGGRDEIGQLSRAFNQMTGKLRAITASRDELNREIAERKQAEEEIRWRALEQETVSRIAHALNTLDVRDAFPVLAEGLRKLTACDQVSLALVDEAGEHFIVSTLESPFPALEEGTVLPLSATAAFKDLVAGRPHLTADLATETGLPAERALYQAGFRSRVSLPLLVGGKLIGALNLVSRQPGLFQEDQLPVLEQVADVLTSAVENARLFQAEREQRELAEALAEATAAISSTLDLDQVLATVLEEVCRLLDATASSVWLIDPETDELVCQQVTGPRSEIVRGWRLAPGEGIAGWVTRTGERLIVPDARTDERYFKEVDQQIGLSLRSILTFPLRAEEGAKEGVKGDVKGSVIGVLQAVDTQVNRFSTADLGLLEPLVTAAAIAIRNARLFEETQRRVAELEVLQHTSLQLSSSLDSSAVLDTIVTSALALVGASDCHIYLYDETTETFTFGTALWEDGRREPAVQSPRPDGFTATVARKGHPVVINDASHHPLYTTPEAREWGMRSIAGFPLKRANRVLGVFTTAFLKLHVFSDGELRVLGLLADQAASAVENSRLYELARRDAETRSVLLREVNHRVKNNLTAIIGLLLAARTRARAEDRTTYQSTMSELMSELIGQVRGLATVHSLLSASEWAPLRLSNLAAQIIGTSLRALPHGKRVSVDVPSSPVRVAPNEAGNLALVINELAANAVKYALGERDAARITFQIALDDGMVRCEFRDDGPGYPEDVLQSKRHMVGLDLIRNILRDSLRGELSLRNDHGAVTIIRFKAAAITKKEDGA